MSSVDGKTLMSIIKIILVKEQFDLMKHYQACIEKSRVPFSYRVEITRGNCIIISDYGVKNLREFLNEHKCFMTLYQIIALFTGYTSFKNLDRDYKNIISGLDHPSLRSLVCYDKLYTTYKEKFIKNMNECKSKFGGV